MREGFLVIGVLAVLVIAPASASAAVLYDQTDNQSTESINNVGAANENADDFIVPDGEQWAIDTVTTPLTDTPTGETVTFYADDGTDDRPLSDRIAQVSASAAGVLTSTVTLNPGHYWVSVVVPSGTNGWIERTTESNGFAVRDDGSGCPRWSLLFICASGHGPDLAFSMSGTSSGGSPIVVDTVADETDAGGTCSLREAVDNADSDTTNGDNGCAAGAGSDTITFSSGLGANPVINLTGSALEFGSTGALTIEGPGDLTVVAATGERVLETSGPAPVSISGLEVTGGNLDVSNAEVEGGGIKNIDAPLTLTHVRVTDNEISGVSIGAGNTTQRGGGIFSNGDLTLINTVVSGNAARSSVNQDLAGAASFGAGVAMGLHAALDMHNSTITENEAEAVNETGGVPTAGYAKANGAGLGILNGGAVVENSTISNNIASATFTGTGTAVEVTATGGGIDVAVPLGMQLSTVAGNRVDASGGTTDQSGGGVFGGGIRVVSSTIAGNGALDGAVNGANVSSMGGVEYANTIISDPLGDNQANCSGSITTSGTPNVDFAPDTGPSCFSLPDPAILTTDPLLGSLQDNGGPTETMLPGATSPALDQGSASDQADSTHDQRGLGRPFDFSGLANASFLTADGGDIGAVEVQQACPIQTAPSISCATSGESASPPSAVPTGQRAAALKKCKKKSKKARNKCKKRAKRLPV